MGTRLGIGAYIARALTETGQTSRRINRFLDRVFKSSKDTNNPHVIALAAHALLAASPAESKKLANRLIQMKQAQDNNIFWRAHHPGIIKSQGQTLTVETTALVVLALLKTDPQAPLAGRALRWILSQKDVNGTWHSNHSTVLPLRAIVQAGLRPSGYHLTSHGAHL